MSSEISTDRASFKPWHFFLLAGLVAAAASVLMLKQTAPAHVVFTSFAILSASLAGLSLYRMLWPLAAADFGDAVESVGERTRAALEREKVRVLRSIKELEFDRAMGKVSAKDFDEMAGRMRRRAVGLMKQLDRGGAGYRSQIELELEQRLRSAGLTPAGKPSVAEARVSAVRNGQIAAAPACAKCGTVYDRDARFCKSCGERLA